MRPGHVATRLSKSATQPVIVKMNFVMDSYVVSRNSLFISYSSFERVRYRMPFRRVLNNQGNAIPVVVLQQH